MSVVYIHWHGPYTLSSLPLHSISFSKGIYAIYRVYAGKEKLIYIGQTTRTFLDRIKEHYYWLGNVRGQIRIRLGILGFPDNQRYSKSKLDDVEALLIVWHSPEENTLNSKWYMGRQDLTVISTGRRGQIDKVISTRDLV